MNPLAKSLKLIPSRCALILGLILLSGLLATAQVGVHTDFPDNSSAMDIVSSNKGLLIPRVTLTSNLSSPSPVTAPAVGLLVFNSGANQAIGFYYWNGSSWNFLSSSAPSGNYWSLTGNSGTTPGTNFLGTTDNNHFLVYTNNTERMRFESDGQVVIDSIAPRNATDLFTVIANTVQKTAIAAYTTGTGYYSKGGRYGLVALVDTSATNLGCGIYARNYDALGYGAFTVGSNITSFPVLTSHTAGITTYGVDGLHAWGRDANGYGIFATGSNGASPFNIGGVSAGLSAIGNYGIISKGTSATGRGIVSVGSGISSITTSNESEGGAFIGYHGIYSKGTGSVEPYGIGVIGLGYNVSNYSIITGRSLGGSFTGNYGVYGKGLASDAVGVLGLGSNGSGYFTVTNGSGGAFTGYHGSLSVGTDVTGGIGVVAAGNGTSYTMMPTTGAGGSFTGINIGIAGYGNNTTNGIGIIGAGNNKGALLPAAGSGGAFSGNNGLYSMGMSANGTGVIGLGNNIANPGTFASGAGGSFIGFAAGTVGWGADGTAGTGMIGAGNNIATPLTYATGSGGAFTGTNLGLYANGTNASSGIGVIGNGNNVTAVLPASGGCGGAFTGVTYGVYGFATNSGNVTRGGGYFACNPTASGAYAWCGYRNNNSNYKVFGNGTVATIVKNTKGELIGLYCPEAPEVLFQDYGIGQLVNGHAHINLDPDFALNINVSDQHPMKVFIQPEGDCKGVYVTNKSANGFDVVELQGGQSNVPFSWQIVATRANEQTMLKDGSVEKTVYDMRFGPAPGPLEVIEQPAVINQMVPVETRKLERVAAGKEDYKADQTCNIQVLEVKEDKVIENHDNPDE
jgi:hypothetical protein